jgi:signal transduction histidine kinase/CheY-like chemotaxis protein
MPRMASEITEKLTRAGLALIQQALSIFDADLRLAVCNPRYQEMFGLPDDLVTPGAAFQDTIRHLVLSGEYGPQPDPETAVRQRVKTASAFQPHYMERQRANGRWISVEGSPLPQGGWVTVYTDITEIKLQEALLRARSEELSGQLFAHAERLALANRALASTNAALEEAKREITEIEARTRLVTEMTPAHIAHIDRDLVYTWSNRRLSSLMPGAPANVVGLHAEVALGTSFGRISDHMRRAVAGDPSVCEITHVDSGRRIRVALTPDPGGGAYILSTDITAETQARAALAQTRKRELAAQLTSGLAHDFANLLTIIMGLQGKLARLDGLPDTAADLVRATQAAARRGGALLQRIGAISGQRDLRPEPVALEPLLDELRMMAAASLPDGLRLDVALEPGLNDLMLDPGALQDSLLNLILNARDAVTGAGNGAGNGQAGRAGPGLPGDIRLSAHRMGETWLDFVVEDDGPGFSDEALRRGLDPFYTTKGGEGSGLGLAMVFDHASLAGGSVRLDNRPGGGARVRLRLPYRPAARPSESLLVLLVEDSPEIRTRVRELLCDEGHSVIEAASAAEAAALATIDGLGLVLSDIHLAGDETGLALAQRLAAHHPGLALGLMTSLPEDDPLHRAARDRFAVLKKPFTDVALTGFVRACIARSATRAQAETA